MTGLTLDSRNYLSPEYDMHDEATYELLKKYVPWLFKYTKEELSMLWEVTDLSVNKDEDRIYDLMYCDYASVRSAAKRCYENYYC